VTGIYYQSDHLCFFYFYMCKRYATYTTTSTSSSLCNYTSLHYMLSL